jgi:hypothetical protein
MGKAAIKRLLTWSFAASQLVVGALGVLRAVMMGTMSNEHFNALVGRGCRGDDSICSIDGSMTRANLRNCLRALLPQVGASRERTKGGHVPMPPCDSADAPSLSSIVQCVVVTLARLGIEIAPSVQMMLGEHEMMPDVGAWTESSFLHGLVEFARPPLLRRHVSTSSQGLALKCGLNNGEADLVRVRHAEVREGDHAEAATAVIRPGRGVKMPAEFARQSR